VFPASARLPPSQNAAVVATRSDPSRGLSPDSAAAFTPARCGEPVVNLPHHQAGSPRGAALRPEKDRPAVGDAPAKKVIHHSNLPPARPCHATL